MGTNKVKQFISQLTFRAGLILLAVVIVMSPALLLPTHPNLAVDTVDASDQALPFKYIRAALNDQPIHADALSCIAGSWALVPLRVVADAAGASINWDKTSNTIIVVRGDKTIRMTVNKTSAYVNDQEITLGVAPQYMNGIAMVPVNLIKDPLELTVNWDPRWRTLSLYTKDYIPPSPPPKVSQPQSFPILMYHELGDGPNNLYVRESEFQEQMKYLKDNNYQVVTLSEAMHMLQNQESTEKVVALTFDDGYESFFKIAWPILHKYNFHATMFYIAYFSGMPNYLNWEQLSMLQADWNEIGSHSENHPALSRLGSRQLHEEVAGSKTLIESCLQMPCETFCYPGGDYNQTVVKAVQDAGYKMAVTTKSGKATLKNDVYLIPRIRVPRGMTLQAFIHSL